MSKMRFFALQELANRRPLEVITPSNKLSDYYGSHVFDRKKMQEYLPKEAYKAVTDAIEKGTPINREMADLIANGMKSWAKSLNVTHYTHWFQPLTDGTAEKHDGFIEFGEDGDVIERFSGKLLIQQELLSPTAVSATHSKRADIRHGTFLHRLSSWRLRSASQQSSFPIQVRRWIIKLLCLKHSLRWIKPRRTSASFSIKT